MTSNFDIERKELMEKVSLGTEQLKISLGELNRNLESINTIGNEFTAPAKIWHLFHKSVMTPDNIPTSLNSNAVSTKQQQETHDYDKLFNQAPSLDDSHSTTHHQ